MTKFAKATIATEIAQRNEALKAKYASKAANAQKRIAQVTAFFATAKAQDALIKYNVDADVLFNRCDKTLDRFRVILDALIRGDVSLRNESDQSRYTYGLVQSVITANAANAKLAKADVLATASKRDSDNEFVTVARRVMSDTTAERQSGIATYVLETLNVFARVKAESGKMTIEANVKSAAFKRFDEIFKARVAA